jgi:hypothetical protein
MNLLKGLREQRERYYKENYASKQWVKPRIFLDSDVLMAVYHFSC